MAIDQANQDLAETETDVGMNALTHIDETTEWEPTPNSHPKESLRAGDLVDGQLILHVMDVRTALYKLSDKDIVDPQTIIDPQVLHDAIESQITASHSRLNILRTIMSGENEASKLSSLRDLATAWGIRIRATDKLTQ